MRKVLVLYYSKHGKTALLAQKIAMGIEQQGAQAIIRTVPEITHKTDFAIEASVPQKGHLYVTKEDLVQCDGLALGSPTHFGNMASPLKYFIDSLTDIWLKGSLVDKPACVFTSSSSMHGGQEATLLSMMLPLLHHGMVITGVPYSTAALMTTETGVTPYGPSHVAGANNQNAISEDEHTISLVLGKRIAELAVALKK